MRSIFGFAVALFVLQAMPTDAQEQTALDDPLRFSLGASTAGPKLEVSYRFAERWAVRAWAGGGVTLFADGSVAGVPYEQRIELGGAAINADYYPFKNRFRISGGAFLTDTFFKGRASGILEIGENSYDVGIQTKIEMRDKVAPFLSVGYELPIGRRLFLTADVGAVYNSGLKVEVQRFRGDPIDVTDILREIAQIKGHDLPVYPFLSLNLAYVF
jgi:outer membrane protein W